MTKNRTLLILSFFFILLVFSCKNESTSTQNSSSDTASNEVIEYLGSGTPKYKISVANTAASDIDATISDWSYDNGQLSFNVDQSDYALGAATSDAEALGLRNDPNGQHIGLVMNKKAVQSLNSNQLELPISDGQYHLLAFLTTSYGESIKSKNAKIARLIEVKDGKLSNEWNIPTPALFFNQPSGLYKDADADKILIDFYPVNIKIGDDAKIKLQINSEQYYIYDWQSFIVEGLPSGKNSIGIQLLDMNGMPLPTPYGSFLRSFDIQRAPKPTEN